MTITEIYMPLLGVNEDQVVLHQWAVERGRKVNVGDTLAHLETTKAAFTLEAEAAGYVYPLVEAGREVPVRALLAILLDQADDTAAEAFLASHRAARTGDTGPQAQLTSRARELAEKHGVDLSALPADRVIRERDILAILGEKNHMLHRDPSRIAAVYGASKAGAAVVEAIRAMGGYAVRAFLDDTPRLIGTTFFGLPVWSGDELEQLPGYGIGAVATHIGVRAFRLKIRDRAVAAGVALLNVIHPRAFVSPSVEMGAGNLIKAGAIVDTEARLGDCCIIDNGAIVAHHNVIGDACHLAPGVALGGECVIGEQTLLGVGSKVASRIQIGRHVIARPGSVIVNDVPDDVLIGGNPAKIAGQRRL